MSFRLYIARLKCLIRNKEGMFWTYAFPLILATCFFFAFTNIWKTEIFETISIAYVSEGSAEDELEDLLRSAKLTDGMRMFDVTEVSREEAKSMLEENAVKAYIVGGDEPALFVKENGINETISKAFLDSYLQRRLAVQEILKENPKALEEGLVEDVMKYDSFVEEARNQKNPDNILVFFYSLLAFTCIFAANWGLDEVVNIQADLSSRGARMNVSPIHKMKLFLCNLLAAFTAHTGSVLLLFSYMYFVMKIDFGENLLYIILICLIGSLAGLATGATIGVWVKSKAETKEAVMLIIVLGGGFLSGMMWVDIKYIIMEKVPILGYINPVALLTDALYSLYYYDTYERYFINASILCVITVLLCVVSYAGIRRKNYASI